MQTARDELSVVHEPVLIGVELIHDLLEIDRLDLVIIQGLQALHQLINAHSSVSILIELNEALIHPNPYISQLLDIVLINAARNERKSRLA